MVTRAELRYIRISPRKFRLIIPIVKGKNPETAIVILSNVKKGASKYAIDLLKSAIANAKRIQGVDIANLFISHFVANCGPQLKRFRAGSMGRASTIRKRTSHIVLELDQVATPASPADAAASAANEKASRKKAVHANVAEKNAPVKQEHEIKPKAKSVKTDTAKKGKG